MKRIPLVLAFLFAVVLIVQPASAQRMRQRFTETHVHVEQIAGGEKVTFPDGTVRDKNQWGTGPLIDGVAVAVEAIGAGVYGTERRNIIGVKGKCGGVTLGGGDPNKAGVAVWPNNEPIRVAIVNEQGEFGSIRGVAIGDSLGGISSVTFCGLTIYTPAGSKQGVAINQGANVGRLCLWEITSEPEDRSNGYNGEWGLIRGHGHTNGEDGPEEAWTKWTGALVEHNGDGIGGGIELVLCVIWPGREHAYYYLDNVGPNSRMYGIKCHPDYDRSRWVERTLGQISNRANPNGTTAGGPSGYGPLEIADIESVPCGGDPHFMSNGQGSALTVAGHLGPVWFHDLDLIGYHGGAIAVWTDAATIKGAWMFADGYATGKVTLENVRCSSTMNTNPHVAIAGARNVRVRGDWLVKGANVGLDIDNSFGGPIGSGPLILELGPTPSTNAGWQQGGPKTRRAQHALTDSQIDALAPIDDTTK